MIETLIDAMPQAGLVPFVDPESRHRAANEGPAEGAVALRLNIVERVRICTDQKGRMIQAMKLLEGVPLEHSPRIDPGDASDVQRACQYIERAAWQSYVKECGIMSAMSVAEREKMENQLYDRHDAGPLPPFTEEILFGFLDKMCADAPAMIERAIKEVFDWLRPRDSYKSNDAFEIGQKVVRGWMATSWCNGGLHIPYGTEKNVDALGNVLSMLDGKGIEKYPNTLSVGVNAAWHEKRVFENDYLTMKGFKNGNAHITFKRMDLVAKINQCAGKTWLRDRQKEASRGFSH